MSVVDSLAPPVVVNRSKIEQPSLSGSWVRRPQVDARLDRAFERSLVVIVAPAGHGKTSTLVSWLSQRALDAAWVTVDRRDADLTRFATHVALALDRIAPGVAPALFALLTAPDRLAPAELGEALQSACTSWTRRPAGAGRFSRSRNRSGGDLHGWADRRAPPVAHQHVLAHQDPAVTTVRTQGEVEELTGADLRFSVKETSRLLSLESGMPVDLVHAASIQESVGGWPAAVRLVALSGGTARRDQPAAGEEGPAQFLRDYVGDEILARLPDAQRDLLVIVSLTDRFNAQLLQALAAGHGGAAMGRAGDRKPARAGPVPRDSRAG
ncbi:MAG: hypothetical protein U0075_14480 [Thermomicrobiales bacterium]